jgi:hypothetical protein
MSQMNGTLEVARDDIDVLMCAQGANPQLPGMTTGSSVAPPEVFLPLLSGRPLRRKNRSRPIDQGAEGEGFRLPETYPAQERAAGAAGWDDPELNEYDEYDEHRKP